MANLENTVLDLEDEKRKAIHRIRISIDMLENAKNSIEGSILATLEMLNNSLKALGE